MYPRDGTQSHGPVASISMSVAIMLVLALAACGGSSKTTPSGSPRPTAKLDDVLENVDKRTNVVATTSIAATAIPRAGSATQSSNVDSDKNTLDKVTAELVEYKDGKLNLRARNERNGATQWTIGSGDTTSVRIDYFDGVEYSKRLSNGDLLLYVESDISSATDTDYLYIGTWLFVPDTANALDDYEIGAFSGGSAQVFDTSALQALTGTAKYEGPAVGVFTDAGEGCQLHTTLIWT